MGFFAESLREVPEGFVVDSQVGVVSGVGVPPDVPHPHVETGVGQDERKTLIDEICQPVGGGAEQSVLQEKHRSCDITAPCKTANILFSFSALSQVRRRFTPQL